MSNRRNRREFFKSSAAPLAGFALGAGLLARTTVAATVGTQGVDLGIPGLPSLTKPGLYILNGPRAIGKTHTLDRIRRNLNGKRAFVSSAWYYCQGTYCTRPDSFGDVERNIAQSRERTFHYFDYSRPIRYTYELQEAAKSANQFVIMTINGGYSNYEEYIRNDQFEQIWYIMSPGRFRVLDNASFNAAWDITRRKRSTT